MEVPGPGIESKPQLRATLQWTGDGTCTSAPTQAAIVRLFTHCATAGTCKNLDNLEAINDESYF